MQYLYRFACILIIVINCWSFAVVFAQDESDELPENPGNGACDYFDVAVATTPIPPQQGRRVATFEKRLANLPSAADIVLIGDSQVNNWSEGDLHDTFGERVVFNFGGSADSTQILLWRLRDELSSLKPKLVILMIGGGNLSNSPPCAIAEGMYAVVERARLLWPEAFILRVDITPRGREFKLRDEVRVTANVLTREKLDGLARVASINLDAELTCGFYPEYPRRSIVDIILFRERSCPNFREDLTHLTSGVGYRVLGNAILRELARLGVSLD